MPRKSAKVESERASLNIGAGSNTSSKRKYTKKATSAIKKANIFVCVLILIVSVGLGALGYFVVSKNDCFTLVGEQEITIVMDVLENETEILGTFVDEDKVKIVEFGKDISSEVIIETDMTQNEDGSYSVKEEGTYYIKYSVDSIKYGKIFTVEKIRLISFIAPSVDEEKEPALSNTSYVEVIK